MPDVSRRSVLEGVGPMTTSLAHLTFRPDGSRWEVVQEHSEPGDFDSVFGYVARRGAYWHAWLNESAARARGLDPKVRILAPGRPCPRTRDEAAQQLLEALRR